MSKDKDNTELMLNGFLNNLGAILEKQNRAVLGKVEEVSQKVDGFADDLDSVKKRSEIHQRRTAYYKKRGRTHQAGCCEKSM